MEGGRGAAPPVGVLTRPQDRAQDVIRGSPQHLLDEVRGVGVDEHLAQTSALRPDRINRLGRISRLQPGPRIRIVLLLRFLRFFRLGQRAQQLEHRLDLRRVNAVLRLLQGDEPDIIGYSQCRQGEEAQRPVRQRARRQLGALPQPGPQLQEVAIGDDPQTPDIDQGGHGPADLVADRAPGALLLPMEEGGDVRAGGRDRTDLVDAVRGAHGARLEGQEPPRGHLPAHRAHLGRNEQVRHAQRGRLHPVDLDGVHEVVGTSFLVECGIADVDGGNTFFAAS